MSDNNLAVKVTNASVRFNMASEKIDNLKEYFVKLVKRQLMFEEFFALKGVNLEIKKGESWGIVGSNGSGKSTLLKLICGIFSPYEGSVQVNGSIAPLIELGAGFDGNLTAKENIYLNGAILGHNKKFMESQYNNIVEFAELHSFMDMPIKNYSSGMRARLGFAIATTVQPQILIVDEVLAVGDMLFRKKCEKRMQEMLSKGTTLIYVSHDHGSVKQLCDKAIWLDKGEAMMMGDVAGVSKGYEDFISDKRIKTAPKRKKEFDYLIVGAGLSGAAFAQRAAESGKKCLVLERRNHVGGNLYCESIENITVHKYGAHIFHTNDKRVWSYIRRFSDFNHYINSPIADYHGERYNLPFNMNTFAQLWGVRTPEEALAKIQEQGGEPGIKAYKQAMETAAKAYEKSLEENPEEAAETEEDCEFTAGNLEEQALGLVGRDIYEKLIKGYTEKQWGRPCAELPPEIIKRIPLRFTYDNNYFNHSFQGIPVEGYVQIIEKMLKNAEVRLNTDYFSDRKKFDSLAEKVVYTGEIDKYFNYCYGPLEYRSLRLEEDILEEQNHQGVAVINYTDRETPYTRIIEHKHFEFGRQAKTVISREYPLEWQPGEEPYYPVRDSKNTELYEQYKALADERKTVIFIGRLAQYMYYDMDRVLQEVLNLTDKEFGVFKKN
ncbi:MAG: ATP-binding cassette domain-containing protein [Spirochaetaceae bacterium]|jgi:UDP-galactopyranose mutase|nr:ATP-binding cassette domain-containing protein [Spirochaetaceae bacterium]